MDKIKQPDKETVRKWLHQGVAQHRRPPDLEQIRRELGWGLIAANERCKHLR
jgi:hypothetical protein